MVNSEPIYDPERLSRYFPLNKRNSFLHNFLSFKLFGKKQEASRKLDETSISPQPGDAVASWKTDRLSVPEEEVYEPLSVVLTTPRDDRYPSDEKATLSTGLAFFFAENPNQHAKLLRMLSFGFDPNVIGPDGNTLLHHVIRIGQFDLIPELVRHGARLDALNKEGQTPFELYRAVGNNRAQDLALLQPRKIEATQAGHAEVQAAPNPETSLPNNEEDPSWIPVDQHVREGHATKIARLLDRGLDPNTRLRSGRSLLGLAVEEGQDDIVDLLLQHGADPLRKDVTGQTPMRLAQTAGRIDLSYKLLCATKRGLESGGNASSEALSRTTAEEPTKTIVWSSTAKIETTAPTTQVEPKAQTVDESQATSAPKLAEPVSVRSSVVKEAEPVLDRLVVDKEPEPQAVVASEGSAPSAVTSSCDNSRRLSEAGFYIRKSRVNDLAHLLEAGLDPNASLSNGHSLLHAAVETYCAPIIDLLLVHGADPKRTDVSGVTAIKAAQNLGRADLAYRLLNTKPGHAMEKPVSPSTPATVQSSAAPSSTSGRSNAGTTTLKLKAARAKAEWNRRIAIHETDYYIRQGRTQDVERWLKEGLDPNTCVDSGKSLLCRATEWNQQEIVDVLLRYGADPCRKDDRGFSALEIARLKRNDALLSVFERRQEPSSSASETSSEEVSDIVTEKTPKTTSDAKSVLSVECPMQLVDKYIREVLSVFDPRQEPSSSASETSSEEVSNTVTEKTPETTSDAKSVLSVEWPMQLVEKYIREDQIAQLKDWLDRGLDANCCLTNGQSLLRFAVEEATVGVSALLLQYGADPMLVDEAGISPMQRARFLRRTRLVHLFERKGETERIVRKEKAEDDVPIGNAFAAYPSTSTVSPLWTETPQTVHEQTKLSKEESVENPVAARPSASIASTPSTEAPKSVYKRKVAKAESFENPFLARASMSSVAKAVKPVSNSESLPSAKWPMSFVEKCVRENRGLQLREFLDRGLDANVCTAKGRSLLRLAVENDAGDVVGLLLDYGADPTLVDNEGITPIWVARVLRRTRFVKLFERYEEERRNAENEDKEDDASVENPATATVGEPKSLEPVVESQKAGSVVEKKDESLPDASVEENDFYDFEEDDMVPFGRSPFDRPEQLRSWKPPVAQPVPYTADDGGIFSAIDESDDEDEDDFVSGLGDVNVTVKRELVEDDTESAVGLHWKNCVVAPEVFEDAWEGISLLPVPIDEKNRFRRWCTGERPDVKEFLEHAEMMHMLALYAESYLNRR